MRLVLACALLGALASSPVLSAGKTPADKASAAVECAETRQQLTPISLEETHSQKKGRVELKATNGCLKGQAEFSVAALLLKLPVYAEPYSIKLDAIIQGTYFLPRIEMLAADLSTMRIFNYRTFRRRGTANSLEVFVNPINAAEQFMLVFVDPEQIGQNDNRSLLSQNVVYASPVFWMYGRDQTRILQAVDQGRLEIHLVGERWNPKKK